MRNRMYGGVRGRKTKVGRKLLRFPPTRLLCILTFASSVINHQFLKRRNGYDASAEAQQSVILQAV